MPTEPKCDVCGTFCGLWLTSDGWRCPVCMWAEVVELREKITRLEAIIACCAAECPPDETLGVNARVAVLAEEAKRLRTENADLRSRLESQRIGPRPSGGWAYEEGK